MVKKSAKWKIFPIKNVQNLIAKMDVIRGDPVVHTLGQLLYMNTECVASSIAKVLSTPGTPFILRSKEKKIWR